MKDPKLYLIYIEESCRRIIQYTNDSNPWMEMPMAVDAVCRNPEIIGEAANKLGDDFRKAHQEIPWRAIIDARNILIHAYDQVNPKLLNGIVERDVPALLENIRTILANWDEG